MKRMIDTFRNRFAELRNDENGMEAAQVILILVLVVVILIPVIRTVVNALSGQGNTAINGINNVTTG